MVDTNTKEEPKTLSITIQKKPVGRMPTSEEIKEINRIGNLSNVEKAEEANKWYKEKLEESDSDSDPGEENGVLLMNVWNQLEKDFNDVEKAAVRRYITLLTEEFKGLYGSDYHNTRENKWALDCIMNG